MSWHNRYFQSKQEDGKILKKKKESILIPKIFDTFGAWNGTVCDTQVCCSVLRCVAVCCGLRHAGVLQGVAVRCSVLQCVAVYCSVLQLVVVCDTHMCYCVVQCGAVWCRVLPCVAACFSVQHSLMLQCGAVCVAVCYSVF